MKKALLFLLLLVISDYSFSGIGTVQYKLGVSCSNVRSRNYNTYPKLGLIIGGAVTLPINNKFSFQQEFLYSQRSFSGSILNARIHYGEFPILINYKFDKLYHFILGPYVALNFFSKSTLKRYSEYHGEETLHYQDNNFKSYDIGTIIGINRKYLTNNLSMILDLRYQLGLVDVSLIDNQKFSILSFSVNFSKNSLHYHPQDKLSTYKNELKTNLKYAIDENTLNLINESKSINDINNIINEFWNANDPLPHTPENELKSEYYDRLTIVNNAFKELNKSGIETDRGRVYMIYGPPDEILQSNLSMEGLRLNDGTMIQAYEVWLYNKAEGGNCINKNIFSNYHAGRMRFVFADFYGLGYYKQIFSTENGEKIDGRTFISR